MVTTSDPFLFCEFFLRSLFPLLKLLIYLVKSLYVVLICIHVLDTGITVPLPSGTAYKTRETLLCGKQWLELNNIVVLHM